MRIKFLATVLAAMTMVGCDGTASPAGVGTGSSETSSSGVSEVQERTRALSVARENGTAMEVQLVGLIVEAVQDIRPRYQGNFNSTLDRWACEVGTDFTRKADFLAHITQELGQAPVPGSEVGIFATGEAADFDASCMAWAWSETLKPMNGWPRPSAPWQSTAGMIEMRGWVADQIVQTEAISKAVAPIANSLSQKPGASIEELRGLARELFIKNATAIRQEYITAIQSVTDRESISIDQTSQQPAPIHAIWGRTDYQNGPQGPQITRSGAVVFGGGYAEGTRYSVEAVISRAATMSTGTAIGTRDESGNTTSTSAEARTQ